MMKCAYCNRKIVLIPSAAERAEKHGGKASDYTKLFTAHADCQIAAWYNRPNPYTGKVGK